MRYLLLYCLLFLFSCTPKDTVLSGKDIIAKSIQKHDPKNQWSSLNIHIRTQEPRINFPTRYSIVKLNNETGAFSLKRDRENSVSTHIIDDKGNPITYLDNNITTDTTLIKNYRLDPNRNFTYRRYYQSFTGLPMSLNIKKFEILDSISNATETIFNNIASYKVSVELNKAMFSKLMNLYFSKKDYTLIGVEMVSSESPDKGERLYFEGSFTIGDVTIPRYKHWHDFSGEYLGSDIIVKELK